MNIVKEDNYIAYTNREQGRNWELYDDLKKEIQNQ